MKKRIRNCIQSIAFIGIIAFAALSCERDDSTTPVPTNPEPTSGNARKYVVGFQSITADKKLADYVLELPSLASLERGELSVEGQGIPLKGWQFFHQAGNKVFTAGYLDEKRVRAFGLNTEGKVVEQSNFNFESTLDNHFTIDNTTLISVELSAAANPETKEIPEPRFHIINAETGKLERIVKQPVDILAFADAATPEEAYMPWVTGMVLREDQLFVSYHKIRPDGSSTSMEVDHAFVAVFKYPEFELEKIIKDSRTTHIGSNGHSTGLIKADNGAIYTFSPSAQSAGIVGATNPSGVLKIKTGATTFDPTYFFDVEAATNGGKMYWMEYVGNGKALARIITKDATLGAWGAYAEQGDFLKLVVLDLEKQTVMDVKGIAGHANRYTAPVFIENGKAYMSSRFGESSAIGSVSDSGETYVYIIDLETATATKGAKVLGVALKGIFKISK